MYEYLIPQKQRKERLSPAKNGHGSPAAGARGRQIMPISFTAPAPVQRQPLREGDNNFGYDYNLQNIIDGRGNVGANLRNENGFHLGWHSIVGFDTHENQFLFHHGNQETRNIEGLMPIPASPLEAGFYEGPLGTQIVTRGVSSCSIIIVSLNGRHAMAHLDRRDLTPESLDRITALVPPDPGHPEVHPEIFVSIHNRPDVPGEAHTTPLPAEFARQLIARYYPGISIGPPPAEMGGLARYLTDEVPLGHNIRVLDRTAQDTDRNPDMFCHSEIGLTLGSGRLQVFGTLLGIDIHSGSLSTSETPFIIDSTAPQEDFDQLNTEGQRQYDLAIISAPPQEYEDDETNSPCCSCCLIV